MFAKIKRLGEFRGVFSAQMLALYPKIRVVFFSCHRVAFFLSFTLLAIASRAQTADPRQSFQDQYQNKIFLLRGFYSDTFLHYDVAGAPMGDPVPGDWTVDGFVLISGVQIKGERLEIEARRLLVISNNRSFQVQADTPKKRRKGEILKIEAELASGDIFATVAAQFSTIFLTNRDSLAALVPDFWEPCVSAALKNADDQNYAYCHFSAELMVVAGMIPRQNMQTESDAELPSSDGTYQFHVYRAGKGISPPKPTFSPEPQFSDAARKVHLQGVVTLGLIVDSRGLPRNVHILSPLGCGLDAEAVRAVRTWRFKAAEREGHELVPVEIAVEADFHLR
ncbi:MAG: energy transducer TonB [Candidatus Sulfotelmatobacter sp.]